MDKRRELGEFLRSRRARVQPEELGLERTARRRVPGLRRQELAQLAGVSVDYYVRLEQGRAGHPSEGVLDALAQALRLDGAERSHLYDLARPLRRSGRTPPPERVRPEVQRLLDSLESVPAMVMGRRMDVLAWNRLAPALFTGWDPLAPDQRNMARRTFLDDDVRRLDPDWEEYARATVAQLRLAAGRYPDDAELAALVAELSGKSEEFRRWWADHDVKEKTHGKKRVEHPIVGRLELSYESFAVKGDSDQILVTWTAEAGSESEAALRLLASLASSPPGDEPVAPGEAASETGQPR
jgi:transcriptional regulator with XRE-family HTH domain